MAADFQSDQLTSLATEGAQLAPGVFGAEIRGYRGRFTMASTAKSKSIAMFTYKAGDIPWAIGMLVDTSLGSAKVSIGINGTTAKYRALATFTGVNLWALYMTEANIASLPSDEEVWVVNDATATLPATGEIVLVGLYTRH